MTNELSLETEVGVFVGWILGIITCLLVWFGYNLVIR